MKTDADFPSLLQAFFTDRLMRQRQASPHTIASYRDTFRLLLSFAEHRLKKAPSMLRLDDLDTPFLGAFLDHLEKERGNSARSRNARLAALHSFFRYVALHEPSMSALAQRVLAIPQKRYHRTQIQFLTRSEIEALMAAPDQTTWGGRRDRTLLLVAVQTGLRVSELTGLCCEHVVLGTGAHLQCTGKGRKDRCTPLRKEAAAALRAWLAERKGQPTDHRLSQCKRPCAQHRRGRVYPGQTRGNCKRALPVVGEETRHTSCTAPHRRHGAASKRC